MAAPLAIIKAIVAHLYLAWIHPFGDGNGRTARLIELQILLAAGFPAPTCQLLQPLQPDPLRREGAGWEPADDAIQGLRLAAVDGVLWS